MEERRGAARHPVYLEALYRGRGQSAAPVTVLDLSALGCRIEGLYSLPEGSCGWLKLDGLEAIYLRVTWARDTFAGMQFETRLHERVLERLVASSAALNRGATELASITMRSRALARNEESLSVALELLTLTAARRPASPGS
jgi:hypothetical protein